MSLQSKSKFNKLLDIFLPGGSIAWVIWVLILFLAYHSQYLQLITKHPYSLLLGVLFLVLASFGVWSYLKLKKQKKISLSFRPWMLIGLTLFVSSLILIGYRETVGLNITKSGSALFHFFLNSLFYLALLSVLGLLLMALGNLLSSRLNYEQTSPLLALALGFGMITFIMVVFGLFNLIYGWLLWVVLIGVAVIQRKYILAITKDIFIKKRSLQIRTWWEFPLMLTGIVFVAFYWLGSIKAYSVGFDGSALYANIAHLSAQYVYLPGAFQPYGWSVVMSLGERLFQSETMNLLLSHFMFIPALAMAYQIARFWLKPRYALLAMIIPLSMPYMGFHTMVDEKVDLGLLFISLSSVYLYLKWQSEDHTNFVFDWKSILNNRTLYPLILLGFLLGYAFSIKFTSLFLIIAIVAAILYKLANKWLYLSILIGSLGLIFLTGYYKWGNIAIEGNEALIIGSIFLTLSLVALIYTIIKKRFSPNIILSSLLVIGFSILLSFSPWMMKHLSEHDFEFSLNNLLYGESDRPRIDLPRDLLSLRFNHSPKQNSNEAAIAILTADQQTSKEDQGNQRIGRRNKPSQDKIGNTKREELQRYLGYEKGPWLYTTIPLDLTFNTNVKGFRTQEIGFLFLAIFPILLLSFGKGWQNWTKIAAVLLGSIIWISTFFWSLTEAESSSDHLRQTITANTALFDNNGEVITPFFLNLFESIQLPFVYLGGALSTVFKNISFLPIYIYLPLLVLGLLSLGFFIRPKIAAWPSGLKYMVALCVGFLTLWLVLGNSISWYAFTPLVLLPVILVYYYEKPELFLGKSMASFSKYLIGASILAQIALNIIILFSGPFINQESKALFQWPMIEYASQSDLGREEVSRYYSPIAQEIAQEINNHPKAKVYRINSFLHYHIDKNDQRVFVDNQLGMFDNITRRIDNQADFFKALKANGFEYIIYALNTPNLDETPEQSLRKKSSDLLTLLRTSPDVNLLMTDHYIEDQRAVKPIRLPNNQMVKARKGIFGKTVYSGTVALYKIN